MRDTTVAARYARALFFVTEKRNETARALEDLQGLRKVLDPQGRTRRFLLTPQVRLVDKREVMRNGLRDKALLVVALFVDLLLRKKRLTEFDTIVTEFESLVEVSQGIQRARVTSAVPMSDGEITRLISTLEDVTRKKIKLSTEVDPSLIGGAQVRIGDRVIDRSVKTLLESVRAQLSEVSV